jgi:glycosyltransferase involved in cell wall biosynthesis
MDNMNNFKNHNMIEYVISDKILTISTSIKENRGGIASVVNALSGYYETFNYIASTKSKNYIMMMCCFGVCLLKLIYYIVFRGIKIVHIHGASYGSFLRKMIIINICHVFKVKTIYHIHGAEFKSFYKRHPAIIGRTIRKATVVLALSESWKEFFSAIIKTDRIVVLNNMVENPGFARAYIFNPPIKFLFLGIIGQRKGIFDLLEVINQNREFLAGKFLFYVGGNGETEKLLEFIKKNRLQDLVSFEGWVSGGSKNKLLRSCDVYVLPSYAEGLPVSILEAMSYGMPVISTTVGGIPEVIEDCGNGFLIKPGDMQALFQRICHFIEHPDDLETLGRRNQEYMKNFYPEAVVPELKKLYEQLLAA